MYILPSCATGRALVREARARIAREAFMVEAVWEKAQSTLALERAEIVSSQF